MTDPIDETAPRGQMEAKRRADALARRKRERNRARKARQRAARREAAGVTPEEAQKRLKQMEADRKARRDHARRMAQIRVMELKGGADRARQISEETALAQRRRDLLEAAKIERRELRKIARARRQDDLDVTIPEQCDRNAFTVRPVDGGAPRRVRRGVIHDPHFQLPGPHFDSACKLERLWAEAGRLGSSGCTALEAWVSNGGVRSTSGEIDEDADRARIVAADRALHACLERIPDLPEIRTPAGWRSQRDAIMICVLGGMPLRELSHERNRGRQSAARSLLARALATLAEILPVGPNEKILA